MIGRYEITERIATGGMAEIYKAKALGADGFEKIVVIKRILPEYTQDSDFVAMFVHEAKLATQLDHPNIVQVFDLGKFGDDYFITMEYVDGPNLHAAAVRSFKMGYRPFPLRECLYAILEACKGLDYAHDKAGADGQPLGIIHRDVSPPNILLTFGGTVKVGDFGVAKARDQAVRTRTGVLKGKFGYMSPEQATGRPLDRRSDVFAIGVVLWELLAAKRLFKGPTPLQTVERVSRCEVPPLSQYSPDLPPPVEAIVRKALAREPEQRYQSAGELGEAISDYLFEVGLKVSARDLGAFLRHIFLDERDSSNEPVWKPTPMPQARSWSALHSPPGEEVPDTQIADAIATEILQVEPSFSESGVEPERSAKYSGGTLLQFHPVHLESSSAGAVPTRRTQLPAQRPPAAQPSHESPTTPASPARREVSRAAAAGPAMGDAPVPSAAIAPARAPAREPAPVPFGEPAITPPTQPAPKKTMAWVWWTLGFIAMAGAMAALIYFSRTTA